MGTGPNDRFAFAGKGAMCMMNQDKVAAFETGIVCIFPMQFQLIDLARPCRHAAGRNRHCRVWR